MDVGLKPEGFLVLAVIAINSPPPFFFLQIFINRIERAMPKISVRDTLDSRIFS